MPNHCETDLTLTGSETLLNHVLTTHFSANGELNCDSITPYPARFKELDEAAEAFDKEHGANPSKRGERPKDGFNQGGYEWRVFNWGSKWNPYDGAGINRRPRSASASFHTAWEPPHSALDKLSELYPELAITAKSYESGAGYAWDYRWKGGERVAADINNTYRGRRGG